MAPNKDSALNLKKKNPKLLHLQAGDLFELIHNNAEFRFHWCPAGTFLMGSPKTEKYRDGDEHQHKVTLTHGFWLLETPVTQKMWRSVTGRNCSRFKGEDRPVECVTWSRSVEFCRKLSEETGYTIELPTEAQWEYACRAGTTGCFGGTGKIDEMGWYGEDWDNGGATHPVRQKKPNAWGLFDMHGNVWEWCADRYGDYPTENVTDPAGPTRGSNRVERGGSWYCDPETCRSAYRGGNDPKRSNNSLGFRCLLRQ